jgi:hypothetical protein
VPPIAGTVGHPAALLFLRAMVPTVAIEDTGTRPPAKPIPGMMRRVVETILRADRRMLSAFGLGGRCSCRRGRLGFRIGSLGRLLSLHHSWRRAASDVASSSSCCCILSSLEGVLSSRS